MTDKLIKDLGLIKDDLDPDSPEAETIRRAILQLQEQEVLLRRYRDKRDAIETTTAPDVISSRFVFADLCQ